MKHIRYTLLSDGSSDTVLLPILTWLLRSHFSDVPIDDAWADLRNLANPPKKLAGRIELSLKLFPCDLLFIHRDAERQTRKQRVGEIEKALRTATVNVPAIIVIPVVMQEAWLLFDEQAIRSAAGNPNGSAKLSLPPLKDVEAIPDPKARLHALLTTASEAKGRRRKNFQPPKHTKRLADLIDDFSPLRQLPAFQQLEADIEALANKG